MTIDAVTESLTEDTPHAFINGSGKSYPVSHPDVVCGLLLTAEPLVAEEALQLPFTQTHHLLHLRVELLHLP